VHQQARAIAYSKKNGHVAVSNNLGDVTILDYDTLSKKVCQLTKPKEWSEVMVYSPDETMLAIGGHDDTLYIYKIVDGDYKLVKACSEFSSAVTALDWSLDSQYLRSIDQAYAKLYHKATGEQVPSGESNFAHDEMMWASNTCKLGWSTQGVFLPGYDGTDINCVDVSPDRQLLVCGDDLGGVFLWRYPAVKNTQQCYRFTGHSEHVPRTRFANLGDGPDPTHVISVGGNDKSIMQWKIVPAPPKVEDEK
jgi:WD40 repeat protein